MKKLILNKILPLLLLAVVVVGCGDSGDHHPKERLDNNYDVARSELASSQTIASDEQLTIAVPIEEHAIRIVREEEEQQQAKLSDQNVKELESWWDSLPKPVQSQIKANKIDIEVVSKIRTNDKNDIDRELNDSQIEKTGETLEQIIGSQTDMTYTVSTTLIDGSQKDNEEHSTNIRLVKQVPVNLQDFKADVFLRSGDVSNDNIRTIQYWWTSLPEGVRLKIKRRELILDLTCHTIASIDDNSTKHLANAEEHVAIVNDIMNRLIGVYKVGKKEVSLAEVNTTTTLDEPNSANVEFPAKQYIEISLRKNKSFVPDTL